MSRTFNEQYFNTIEELETNPLPYDETLDKLKQFSNGEYYDRDTISSMAVIFSQKCNLCGVVLESYLDCNDAYPLKEEGSCCHNCNSKKVIPARMRDLKL